MNRTHDDIIEVSYQSLDVGFDPRAQGIRVHLPAGKRYVVHYEDRQGNPRICKGSARQIIAVLRKAGYKVVR
jgi:hypothetical protein